MTYRPQCAGLIVAIATCCLSPSRSDAQERAGSAANRIPTRASAWVVPRTSDGQPDLQGVWDYRTATPLERPAQFKDKAFLTDAEVAAYERLAAERPDGRPPDDPRTDPSVQAPSWLDYGKRVVADNRTSLIVDPADGRIPPLTPGAQKREADRRAAARAHGSADSAEDRSLWERCITRGLPEGVLPAGYNNNIQIFQTPGHVGLLMEMIHDARIAPLDGRPHLPRGVTQWMGDSRGRWEGDTLVVETTNFSGKVNFRGAGEHLRLVERFTRTGENTIDYRFTAEDRTTWVQPWTVAVPLVRNEGLTYEYACHEGNLGLRNILGYARALENAANDQR
jgi:hypothetical protein